MKAVLTLAISAAMLALCSALYTGVLENQSVAAGIVGASLGMHLWTFLVEAART